MQNEASQIYISIQKEIAELPLNEFLLSSDEESTLRSKKIQQLITLKTQELKPITKARIEDEFDSWGPLNSLIDDTSITEIIVNGPNHIWYEKGGTLHAHSDFFFSELSYRNCLERICQNFKSSYFS